MQTDDLQFFAQQSVHTSSGDKRGAQHMHIEQIETTYSTNEKRLKYEHESKQDVYNVLLPDDLIVKIVNYKPPMLICAKFGVDLYADMSKFETFGSFEGIIHRNKFTCNVGIEWINNQGSAKNI